MRSSCHGRDSVIEEPQPWGAQGLGAPESCKGHATGGEGMYKGASLMRSKNHSSISREPEVVVVGARMRGTWYDGA